MVYRSDSFTYQAVSESNRRVLVVAAEDRTGASPVQAPGSYAQYYLDAVADAGFSADVYDIDARGRTAPDQLGVLSHYDAVLWYTGDDVVTRTAGRRPGQRRPARARPDARGAGVHERGRPRALHGQAGRPPVLARGREPVLRPEGRDRVRPDAAAGHRSAAVPAAAGLGRRHERRARVLARRVRLRGRTTAPTRAGGVFDVNGLDDPLAGLEWSFNGPDSANNQNTGGSFVATSGILPPDEFPQFESWPSARWDKPGGPFEPHTGDQYVYSQIADVSYKRLTRQIAVPAGGGNLTFWTSYDTESHWDHLFVEARTAGGDNWTTLPDANGHTTQDTGDSCAAGLDRAAPAARALPDLGRRQHLHADRLGRRPVARRVRELGRLAAVVDQPRCLRRADGRDLDRLRERLVGAEPRRVPRRHRRRRTGRRRRSRPASTAGRSPGRRPAAGRTRTTGPARTPPASRSGPRSARPTRC